MSELASGTAPHHCCCCAVLACHEVPPIVLGSDHVDSLGEDKVQSSRSKRTAADQSFRIKLFMLCYRSMLSNVIMCVAFAVTWKPCFLLQLPSQPPSQLLLLASHDLYVVPLDPLGVV